MDQERRTRRFYELIWPLRADVLRVARFLSRNPVAAEDLTQETLMKAFRAVDRVQAGPGVKAWLLQILRNTWLDRVRSVAERPAEVNLGELASEPEAPPQVEEGGAWGDPRAVLEAFSDEQVIEALRAIPEEICWTLLLVDVEGLSLQEAAEVLAVPTGTVKSRAHRGRGMLREKLLPLARELKLVPGDSSSEPEES